MLSYLVTNDKNDSHEHGAKLKNNVVIKTHLLGGGLALFVFLACDEQLLDHFVDLELALHGVQYLSGEYVEASAGA